MSNSVLSPRFFAAQWVRKVLSPAVEVLAGKDGRLSRSEASRTEKLDGPAKLAADNLADVFDATGVKTAASVSTVLRVGEAWALGEATRLAGADGVLSTSDVESAPSLRADFDLLAAIPAELGIISDLDSTVIPPEEKGLMPPPYPGVAALYRALEFGSDGTGDAGDLTYVTARSPERVTLVPEYLSEHQLPAGPIETGTSTVPWTARAEKVRDIEQVFAARPEQRFVLFGDSSHVDPEAYGDILSRHPDRVEAVFIHQVTETVEPARVEGMTLIQDYEEAALLLGARGLLSEAAVASVVAAVHSDRSA